MRVSTTSGTLATFLTAALALGTPTPAQAWVNPATGSAFAEAVVRPAQIPERNWLPGHRGVDLHLTPGDAVRAAGDGKVAFVGVVVGVPTVSLQHADGLRTTYQPVRTTLKVGEVVAEGASIGTLARWAKPDHVGLHWGVLVASDTYVDPLTLLDAPVIRLKPVDAPGRRRV